MSVPDSSVAASASTPAVHQRSSLSAQWSPLDASKPSVGATPLVGAASYDRARLIDFIATTNQSVPTLLGPHTADTKPALYTSALTQLAKELAKVQNVAWEKVRTHADTGTLRVRFFHRV